MWVGDVWRAERRPDRCEITSGALRGIGNAVAIGVCEVNLCGIRNPVGVGVGQVRPGGISNSVTVGIGVDIVRYAVAIGVPHRLVASEPSRVQRVQRQLRKLDNYDFLVLDDLGYLPQGAEESEVLFTLIAERYERRSLGITSNLVFSQWEHIFANPMATAAAIDRVVHHSVILEFDVPSYRTGVAQQRGQEREVNRQE